MEFSFIIPVLVVDENEPVRKSLHHLVTTADDIKILATATNGIDAVEKARSDQPDVAVMDISMPLMDGFEATELIRECCGPTPVIIFSGVKGPEYVRRALEVGT